MKKKSKILSALIIVIMLCTLTAFFAACGDPNKDTEDTEIKGTYYIYEDGAHNKSCYVTINESTWTTTILPSDGFYTKSENSIKMLIGNPSNDPENSQEVATATFNNGVLNMKIMGSADLVLYKETRKPSTNNNVNGIYYRFFDGTEKDDRAFIILGESSCISVDLDHGAVSTAEYIITGNSITITADTSEGVMQMTGTLTDGILILHDEYNNTNNYFCKNGKTPLIPEHIGNYYLYENGNYENELYINLTVSNWKVALKSMPSIGNSQNGKYILAGETITLYSGNGTTTFATGTLKNDILTLTFENGEAMIFCKEGKRPI